MSHVTRTDPEMVEYVDLGIVPKKMTVKRNFLEEKAFAN